MGNFTAPDASFLLSRKMIGWNENVPHPHSQSIQNINAPPLRFPPVVFMKTCHTRCICFSLCCGSTVMASRCLHHTFQQWALVLYAETGQVLPANEGEQRSVCSFLPGSGASCAEVRADVCLAHLALCLLNTAAQTYRVWACCGPQDNRPLSIALFIAWRHSSAITLYGHRVIRWNSRVSLCLLARGEPVII